MEDKAGMSEATDEGGEGEASGEEAGTGCAAVQQVTSPWPHAETSSATPIGLCPRCGGQRYALLTHLCTTNANLDLRRLSPLGGGPDPFKDRAR